MNYEESLRSLGLEEYIKAFQENDIDEETVLLLGQEQLKELIPKIGPRLKFKKLIDEIKSQAQQDLTLTDECPHSQAQQDLTLTDDTFLSGHKETSESQATVYELNNNGNKIDTVEHAHVSGKFAAGYNQNSRSLDGRAVIKEGQSCAGLLKEGSRRKLSQIIINHFIENKPNYKITTEEFYKLAAEIVTLFPKESIVVYYSAYVARDDGAAKKNASGKLYESYITRRRKLRQSGELPGTSRRTSSSCSSTRSSVTNDSTSENSDSNAMVHCNKRGSEMLCGDLSHIHKREGGLSQLGGVLVSAMKNLPDGTFDLDDLENHIRGSDIHEPVTMMVCIENTHSFCGGKVLPLMWLDQLAALSKRNALSLHMDGARLFNAAEYLHIPPGTIAQYCDSLSVCFSKGLGAPVGSALAGTRRFIDQARKYRKMLGGGMRQVGVIAAAALVALEESVPALGVDHRKAQYLGAAINNLGLQMFTVDLINIHTNIVHVDINNLKVTSGKVAERLMLTTQAELSEDYSLGHSVAVLCSSKPDSRTLRFVTHHDVDENDLTLAVKKIQFVLKEIDKNCK